MVKTWRRKKDFEDKICETHHKPAQGFSRSSVNPRSQMHMKHTGFRWSYFTANFELLVLSVGSIKLIELN